MNSKSAVYVRGGVPLPTGGTTYRYFPASKYRAGVAGAMAAAKRWTNRLGRELWGHRWPVEAHLAQPNRSLSKNNRTGATGVWFYDSARGQMYVAQWRDGKRTVRRSFSVSKYGDEGAFNLACQARREALEALGFFPS